MLFTIFATLIKYQRNLEQLPIISTKSIQKHVEYSFYKPLHSQMSQSFSSFLISQFSGHPMYGQGKSGSGGGSAECNFKKNAYYSHTYNILKIYLD